MDAAAHDHAAFAHGSERRRHERADRREDDGGIERLGRHLVRAAGPHRAELARELLRLGVAGSREGVDLASLMARDLRHDMGRRAEAVDAEPLAGLLRA